MSTVGLVGHVPNFDADSDDFQLYVEQLEQYFLANDIPETKQNSVLLSVIGTKTYKLLRNLLMPKLPSACSYGELTKILKEYFKPAPIIIAERFRFHRRDQQVNESVSDYLVELRRLASTCQFGNFLDEALRDRFVCGLSSETTQRRLLAKKDLVLSTATEMAQAMEIADNDAAKMKMITPVVNKVQQTKGNFHAAKNGKAKVNKAQGKCFRCGAFHDASKCKYRTATCHACSKVGHISPVCMSKKMASTKKVEAYQSPEEEYNLFAVQSVHKVSKYSVTVALNGLSTEMELDTAADVSIISEWWIQKNLCNAQIQPTSIVLRDYNQSVIEVVGETQVKVSYGTQCHVLPLVIVKGNRPALFGKNWLSKFKLNWNEIFSVDVSNNIFTSVESLKNAYIDLFKDTNEPIKHFKAKLKMKKGFTPTFCKARPVPYSVKQKVADEIMKTKDRGVWDFVEHSSWATPIVVVPKKNGSIRLCGDFKITANKYLDPNQYPLPTQQDLFSSLNGGKFFSKLDLSHAYQQIELAEDSREYLTLNTHLGLVRPNRLLYGITCAASVFQSVMEQIVQGLPSVICFQDDILVTGSTQQEHFENLNKVFERFRKYNVKLNSNKCEFLKSSIEFLGHKIDAQGIHPTDEKIQCIMNINTPTNVTELKSFLGLLNYYAKFIKNASMILAPLYELLHSDTAWNWTSERDETFKKCKNLLTSSAVLVHYDEKLPIKLSCDASPFGLGVVLSHVLGHEERPIAYASRTLSKAEKNYSQLEKEASSIIFGIKKFHQYIYGRKFTIVTDHKPLITIFGVEKSVPTLAAARLQRWAVLLSSFQYSIEYKKGIEHTNADALSRAPVTYEEVEEAEVFKISYSEDLPITSVDIANATRNDAVLGPALKYVQNGWPENLNSDVLKPFHIRRSELSVDNNCLLWGMRVIIPSKYRQRLLEQLHDTHSGVCRMKAVARSHIWWPNLDRDIEILAKQCSSCQVNAKTPPGTPLQPWTWCKAPMDRVHIDFAQKDQKDYLLFVDSHSKWLEVMHMPSTTSSYTIEALHQIFSRYGLPLELVSDNGPQLISDEFKSFLKSNAVKHVLIPKYHPQSNGLAERTVQTFKEALKKMNIDVNDHDSVSRKISRFLMSYRSTPHTTTGSSPAELFLSRQIRTPLALVHPSTMTRVLQKQADQKKYYDRGHTTNRYFAPNQSIFVRSHKKQQWSSGKLITQQGNKTWIVEVNNKRYLAHVDQLRANSCTDSSRNLDNFDYPEVINEAERVRSTIPLQVASECTIPNVSDAEENNITTQDPEIQSATPSSTNELELNDDLPKTPVSPTVRRNPQRKRQKPERLNL